MFERMSDEMFWKSGGDLEQQLHPARLPPFARASVSRLCPNHGNKPSAITITIKPPVHTEIQILSTITEIQILSNIKEIQIQTLREVEGQRDLLPAQVQCLHLFRLSICNDGPDVFSAMNGYRIRDTRGKQNC